MTQSHQAFYQDLIQQNPELRRAEARDARPSGRALTAAVADPVHAGLYQLAILKMKSVQDALAEPAAASQALAVLAVEGMDVAPDAVETPMAAENMAPVVLAALADQPASPAPVPVVKAKSAKPEDEEEDDDVIPLPWIMGGVGALGIGIAMGNDSSTDSGDHDCDIEVATPARPSSLGALVLSAGPGEFSGGSGLTATAGQSIILTAVMLGSVSADITSAFDLGDIYASADASGQILATVETTGSVGDIALLLGEGTSGDYAQLSVSAGNDVGDVSFILNAIEANGTLRVNAEGGDINSVSVLANNASGSSYAYVSAFAVVSGDALQGGNVGDIKVKSDSEAAQFDLRVRASGGDVGNIDLCVDAMEAVVNVRVSAIAQVNGLDEVIGGNVGDIFIVGSQESGEAQVTVTAAAATDSLGNYLGGGNIGDLVLSAYDTGTSDGAQVSAYAVGGGSIGSISVTNTGGNGGSATVEAAVDNGGDVGDISILVLGSGAKSASASVELSLAGTSGNVSEVGDIRLDLHGGQNNSASIEINYVDRWAAELALYANIGNITAVNHGGGSGEIDIVVQAGVGSVIGDVSLTDNGRFSQNYINLAADVSIGNVTALQGGGSGNLEVRITSDSGTGSIGTIDIDVASDNFASDDDSGSNGHAVSLEYVAASGTTVSDISISGGTQFASLRILATDAGVSEVIGDLDLSGFAGFSFVNVSEVLTGVRIDVGQGGSLLAGTEGTDEIYLGDGDDTISFQYFDTGEGVDEIFDFEAGADALDVEGDTPAFVPLTSNVATTISSGNVVSLVDLAGGEDLSTAVGLLAALNSGEYANVDSAVGGGTFTFVTGASDSAGAFNLYEVAHDGATYTNAYLMATVDFKTGSTFGDLTSADFV